MTEIIDLKSRLELFVDDYLIEDLQGEIEYYIHQPCSENVVLSDDRPWEKSIAYFSVMQDGDLFRMYYRADYQEDGEKSLGEATSYAESKDGINWVKPELGLFNVTEFDNAPSNIVIGGDINKFPATSKWKGNWERDIRWNSDVVPFIDNRPGVEPDARYKALVRGCRGFMRMENQRWDYGMYPFKSPDGLNWTAMTDKPVITNGRFDSQNLGFWDAVNSRYVAFVRDCRNVRGADVKKQNDSKDFEVIPVGERYRDIRVSFSCDFVNWTEPIFVEYPGEMPKNLYTNAVIPYERAPHILLGFPTCIHEATSQTEPILMSSRNGGVTFKRWDKSLIPPETPRERDGNRSNYMARGLLRANAREYYVYATEGYNDGESRRLRRFVYRTDGFISLRAGDSDATVLTRIFTFSGDQLRVNFATASDGFIKFELCDISGSTLAVSKRLHGDEIEQVVSWENREDIKEFAGEKIRMRATMKNADLYSIKFISGINNEQ